MCLFVLGFWVFFFFLFYVLGKGDKTRECKRVSQTLDH